ncbi:unnamed protein product [Notodromas monacha]|uniref:JmjC domain-containing protein n=1 Tax=Notodromas monacha TaxID=399045 RepID=A0A7R9GF74_9CRUS|nr:unnamed protein product [Notodromas monacha]CAG0918831.1 unnamed protein product [Notodromas monacha]
MCIWNCLRVCDFVPWNLESFGHGTYVGKVLHVLLALVNQRSAAAAYLMPDLIRLLDPNGEGKVTWSVSDDTLWAKFSKVKLQSVSDQQVTKLKSSGVFGVVNKSRNTTKDMATPLQHFMKVKEMNAMHPKNLVECNNAGDPPVLPPVQAQSSSCTSVKLTPNEIEKYRNDFWEKLLQLEAEGVMEELPYITELHIEEPEEVVKRYKVDLSVMHGNRLPLLLTSLKGRTWFPGIMDLSVMHGNQLPLLLTSLKGRTWFPGITSPFYFLGARGTAFAMHSEDMDLVLINLSLGGYPKIWYGIPMEHLAQYKAVLKLHLGAGACDVPARHKHFLFAEGFLHKYGIKPVIAVQEPWEMIVTFPKGHHGGFNTGFNWNVAVNFAPEFWIDYGIAAVNCSCDMTQPDVSEAATLLYEQGQTTFHELAASLRAQFNKSRFDYLQRFQSLVPHANETYVNYGCRLREAYLKYLPAPPGNLPAQEALITHALIGQFLTTIQGAIASHMQGRALAEPNVTWKQFCTYADEFRLTHPHAWVIINRGPTANQPIRKPNAQRPSSASGASSSSGSTDRRMHFCIHHDRMAAHTSEECSIHTGQPPPAHFCEKHQKSRGRQLHGAGKRDSRAVTAVLCTVPTPQAAQDRITLLISIKDQKCTALIDTGASKSFIAAEVAQSLQLPTNPVAASIAVAVTNISLLLNQSVREHLYRERSPSLSSGPTASPATDSAPSATQEMDLDCDDDSLLAAEDALYLEESGGLTAIDLFDEEALLADPPGAEEDVTST